MKIAIVSCNIGGIDEFHPIAKQKEDYELFYYTENTLPFPLPNLDNRMKGKYLKTQTHKFLDHDLIIWIDGSIEIIDGTFLNFVIERMAKCDIMVTLHEERKNVFEELEYIQNQVRKGSNYLKQRYINQPFDAEKKFYEDNFVDNIPLFNCFFFARWNNEKLNKAFDEWWDLILRYSNLDQTQFSYAMWKRKIKIESPIMDSYIQRHKHK